MKLYAPDMMEPPVKEEEKKENDSSKYRGVRDEILEQQKKTRDMSLKGRLAYFWYYYKIHLLVIVCVTAFVVTFIYNIVTARDAAFTGMMLNAAGLDSVELSDAFAEYAGIDTQTYDCSLDTQSTLSYMQMSETDLATSQKLAAQIQTKELDAAVFDSIPFNLYANNGVFADLRTLYSAEELENYDLYYVDYAEIKRADADSSYENKNQLDFDDPNVFTEEAIAAEAESHRHPEAMEEPVPVGIFMAKSPFALKTHAYDHAIPLFGIIVNTEHADLAKQYLDFLWNENIAFEQAMRQY